MSVQLKKDETVFKILDNAEQKEIFEEKITRIKKNV